MFFTQLFVNVLSALYIALTPTYAKGQVSKIINHLVCEIVQFLMCFQNAVTKQPVCAPTKLIGWCWQ